MKYMRNHPGLIGFFVLFLANMLGFALVAQNSKEDQRRAYGASVSICQSSYDNRHAIIAFIEGQTVQMPYAPDADEASRAATDRTNERRRVLREQALSTFSPPACIDALNLRVADNGQLVPR